LRLLAGRRPGAWQLLVWGVVGAAALVLVPLVPIQLHVVRELRAEHAAAVEALRAKHSGRWPTRLASQAELVGVLSGVSALLQRHGELEHGRGRLVELLARPDAQRLILRDAWLDSSWRTFVQPQTIARRVVASAFVVNGDGVRRGTADAVERLALALELCALFWGSWQRGTGLDDGLLVELEGIAGDPALARAAFEALEPRLAALASSASARDAVLVWWLSGLDDGLELERGAPWALWDAEHALRADLARIAVVDAALDDPARCPEGWRPSSGAGFALRSQQLTLHRLQRRIWFSRWVLALGAFRAQHGRPARVPEELGELFGGSLPAAPCAAESIEEELRKLLELEWR
jgi:hypothetical protein